VGFQRERSSWENPNLYGAGGTNAERLIYSPGRIALDLAREDIFNYAGTAINNYAGKFIVYNMNYATFNSVDPYGFSRFNTGGYVNEPNNGNMRLIDYNNGEGYNKAIWPRMFEMYGGSYTDVYVQQASYYINDLWTINDRHSLMAGLRYDMYKVWDTKGQGDIYSYNMPTFRFEYKFDLNGDQKRVFNLSWGQFHNMAPVSSWAAFVSRGIREMIWNEGPTDGSPYLVDFPDIMDASKYRTITDNVSGGGVNEVADGFKGLVTTELTLGVRLNLDNGGSIRATYVNRSWANDYAYLYNNWKDNPNGDGTKVYSRLLANLDLERSYNSIELEWDVPVTKRVDFGGSYTFSRYMSNGTSEADSPQKSANKSVFYWPYYDADFDYPYWGYNPVRLRDPEHRFNAWINYDLTYGKVKSNVALRFAYVSAGPSPRSFTYEMGYPIIPGVTTSIAGEGQPTMPDNTGISGTRTVYYNIHRTSGPDSWSTNLTYNLEVPVTNRVRWLATITCSNPFNHRGKSSGWYGLDGWGGLGNYTPNTLYRLDGSVYRQANNPYQYGGIGMSAYGQSNYGNLFSPNHVQGGRSIGLQTGLRF
jgi:hypothetical protein